jgi:hypothetical protein
MPVATTSTAERRRNIHIATVTARRASIARREAASAAVEQAYQSAADRIRDWLQDNAGPDGRLGPESLALFDGFLQQVLAQLAEDWIDRLEVGLAEAAALAIGIRTADLGDGGAVIRRALRFVHEFTGADGLQLSDRLWRVNQHTLRTIDETIRGGVLRGTSARHAAEDLLARAQTVPADLIAQANAANAGTLGKQVDSALMTGEGNPMRNALRVMRTEINRAHTEAFVASAFEHPDVAAVKFNLSPLHPRPDVCDLHAAANLHGLGPGVYPQGQHPYPAHPETLSYLTVVFVDEITDADRAGKQSPLGWLRAQPAATQSAVIGKHKAQALRAGQLLESEWDAPWRQVRDRLKENP